MSTPDLDSPEVYRHYDPDGMLDRIAALPDQCEQAWHTALEFRLPPDYSGIDKVVVLGMGGSAIGGDLVKSLTATRGRVPVFVWRDYDLPAFVDARTLVIASSYSGETEETLSSFERALNTDCKRLVITAGGHLKSLALSRGVPAFVFSYPGQPRAALGFSFMPLLCFMQRLGLVDDVSGDVSEAVAVMRDMSRRIGETAPASHNLAKSLATRLYGRLAVVYGAGMLSGVARRWKTQLNENGKSWAFHEVLPELNHNAVAGYRFPPELAGRITVVMLASGQLSARMRLRYRETGRLLEQAGVAYQVVDGEGDSPLSQLLSLVLLGDYTSCYLAVLNRVDPTPVKSIAYLKEQLGKGEAK